MPLLEEDGEDSSAGGGSGGDGTAADKAVRVESDDGRCSLVEIPHAGHENVYFFPAWTHEIGLSCCMSSAQHFHVTLSFVLPKIMVTVKTCALHQHLTVLSLSRPPPSLLATSLDALINRVEGRRRLQGMDGVAPSTCVPPHAAPTAVATVATVHWVEWLGHLWTLVRCSFLNQAMPECKLPAVANFSNNFLSLAASSDTTTTATAKATATTGTFE